MFRSSSEEIAVSFIIISDIAVTARVYINQKGADLFIKGVFEPQQNV